MEEFVDAAPPPPPPPMPPAPPRRGRGRWLLIGGLALAFALSLGVGALVGSTIGSSRAAAFSPVGVVSAYNPQAFDQGHPGGPGAHGQCGVLTVTSVSGQTIVAKEQDGSSVTIHTSSSTKYTKAGQPASASAITVGSQLHVDGTHNSDGSITATSIDIAG
ncbi:MAG TPA: DUF5666 domain-containing protein [Ktedonobacterales bacterium]